MQCVLVVGSLLGFIILYSLVCLLCDLEQITFFNSILNLNCLFIKSAGRDSALFWKHQAYEMWWKIIANVKLFTVLTICFYVSSCFSNCGAFQDKLDQESTETKRIMVSNFPLCLMGEFCCNSWPED